MADEGKVYELPKRSNPEEDTRPLRFALLRAAREHDPSIISLHVDSYDEQGRVCIVTFQREI